MSEDFLQNKFDTTEEYLAGQVLGDLAMGEARELAARRNREHESAATAIELAASAVLLTQPGIDPKAEMPAHLRSKILEQGKVWVGPPKPLQSRFPMAWLVAAAAAIFAVAGWWNRPAVVEAPQPPSVAELRNNLVGTGVKTLAWSKTPDAAAQAAEGDVVWSDAKQQGFMRFKGLAANDPNQSTYQLWIFDETRDQKYPVDGGVFNVTSGEILVPIQAKIRVGKAVLFAITVEPPGGVVVSKRERIVLTAKPS